MMLLITTLTCQIGDTKASADHVSGSRKRHELSRSSSRLFTCSIVHNLPTKHQRRSTLKIGLSTRSVLPTTVDRDPVFLAAESQGKYDAKL